MLILRNPKLVFLVEASICLGVVIVSPSLNVNWHQIDAIIASVAAFAGNWQPFGPKFGRSVQPKLCDMLYKCVLRSIPPCQDSTMCKRAISWVAKVPRSSRRRVLLMHAYIYTYTYIYIHIYIYTYMHIYINTYIHIYIYTYIHIYIYTYIHIYTYTHIHIYIHTYIHTHMYACMYVCMYLHYDMI